MRQTQGVFLTGYVTIKVTGQYPELFYDLCAKKGITVWNIKKISRTECQGNIRLKDVSRVKRIRRSTIYKVSFIHKRGIPFLSKRIFINKPLIIGLVLSFLFVFFLSNIVWDVKVKGVHPEIEKEIIEQLNSYGLHPGALKFNTDSPGEIQQRLLNDIPELLWVGVTEKGTTYHLEGVEKTVIEEEEQDGPRNLVAAKEGVIVDIYVSKGQPIVKVNDFVEKGDLLVSGQLGKQENKEDDDEENENDEPDNKHVTAEGEVIAQTWYESQVNIPLETNYEVLTGENKHNYYLKLGSISIPIWGFGNPDYKETQIDSNEKKFNFLNWELPISFVDDNVQEKKFIKKKRTKAEAKADGIKQAREDLQKQLGPKAEITSEKVLHERVDNGKVKLNLYFTVEEDIVKIQPLSQGD